MSIHSLFAGLAAHLQSAEFRLLAAHPDHPTAFTRQRKLPLPALVALMLSGMRKSVQAELDAFFAHLRQHAYTQELLQAIPLPDVDPDWVNAVQ